MSSSCHFFGVDATQEGVWGSVRAEEENGSAEGPCLGDGCWETFKAAHYTYHKTSNMSVCVYVYVCGELCLPYIYFHKMY